MCENKGSVTPYGEYDVYCTADGKALEAWQRRGFTETVKDVIGHQLHQSSDGKHIIRRPMVPDDVAAGVRIMNGELKTVRWPWES